MHRALILLILSLATIGVGAMEVRTVQWGFDGKAVPGHVNLLSLLIANPGSVPMEGPLELAVGGGFHEGAPWQVGLYLAPGTARWVQFNPWISERDGEFTLTWRPSGEHVEIKAPELGAPATVLLTDSDRLAMTGGAIKRFPDEIFPATVAATDGLDAVVLDHAPRWEPPRRQAFADWLRRGGTVHLLQTEGGGQPHFIGELAFLDQPGEHFRIGAGTVVRHQAGRAGFGLAQLAGAGFAPPTLVEGKDGGYRRPMHELFFELLAGLVKPKHEWGLIYLLLGAYLLALGPGAFLLARRRMDWRAVNLGLVAVIVTCSLLMWAVGRRGFGEQEVLRTIGYAQALGGDGWDTTQWSSCFVTSSGQYRFAHHGDANIYACPGSAETIDGTIAVDGGGQFAATLPLYSSRSFLHRARLRGPSAEPKLRKLEAAAALTALDLDLPEGWPLPVSQAQALYRGRIHRLQVNGRMLSLVPSSDRDSAEYCKVEGQRAANERSGQERWADEGFAKVLGEEFPALVAYSLGESGVARHAVARPVDPDLVTLFVLAPQARDFQALGEGLGRQEGIVLYRIDLVLPNAIAPAGTSGQKKADP